MTIRQAEDKDISKVFNLLRAQLQAKEKELLQLQQTDPCLSAPDSDQIDMLVHAIDSLQLSTQDGSFVFESNFDSNYIPSNASVFSVEFNAIKTLPSSVWLPQSRPVKKQNEQQSSFFDHLLSLPMDAYLASSSPSFQTTIKTHNQVFSHIPIANPLLFMPINSFKPPSNHFTFMEIKNNKNLYLENNILPTAGTSKSLLKTGMIYSKEVWLRNSQEA